MSDGENDTIATERTFNHYERRNNILARVKGHKGKDNSFRHVPRSSYNQ